jgi:hypothetical protein
VQEASSGFVVLSLQLLEVLTPIHLHDQRGRGAKEVNDVRSGADGGT